MPLNRNNMDELIQLIESDPILTHQIIITFLKDIKIMLTSDTKEVEQTVKKYDNILNELENFK